MGNKQGAPSAEVSKLASTTSFSEAELKQLYVDFKATDKDKSGALDLKEFQSLMKKYLTGTSDDGLAALFKAFDSDNSGNITFRELATALSMLGKGTPEQKLSFMFDVFDDDKSGHLDRSEVQKIVDQMKAVAVVLKRDPEHVDQFMKALLTKIDKDGDGNISKEEWVQGGLRTPSLLVLLGANQF
eukprot:TRINITY_DN795_c0_g1_i1.p1 TRINITY_DN795_c0_g1~~TRINITY_DN795_c0_g1_i1.p1  ORF type:complete len:201 (-),score=74.59 TRINITY_DN795_c0_g1_i1:139-696(-)